MCVSVTDDILYIHGGYSKEKVSGQKKEGRVHEDMYVLTHARTRTYSTCEYLMHVCRSVYCKLLYIHML